jgi:hypothetical protein
MVRTHYVWDVIKLAFLAQIRLKQAALHVVAMWMEENWIPQQANVSATFDILRSELNRARRATIHVERVQTTLNLDV